MFPGPVFTHELRTVARKPRFYVIRFLCGLFLLYLIVTTSWRWNNSNRTLTLDELADVGSGLFLMTVWIQGSTAVFLTPAIVAGTIAEARQRKVLHYLLASPLSNGEIVLSKLLVRLLYLVILVMVGFPVMSLALLLGGVDPIILALTEGGVLSIIFLLGSVSMFTSSRLQKPRDAILCTYGFVFVWLMLPVIKEVVRHELVPLAASVYDPVVRFLSVIELSSPTGILDAGLGPGRRGSIVPVSPVFWMIGLNFLSGLVLLVPTVRGLRSRERDEGKGRKGWIFGARDRQRGWLRSRPFSLDDPMLWKECPGRYRFRSPALRVLVTVLKLAVAGLLGYWMLVYAWPAFSDVLKFGYGLGGGNYFDPRRRFNEGVRFATVCGYLLLILLLAAASAGSITSEKEKDSWISLISTPMDGREILRGKIVGAFWSARYVFAGLLILWWTGLIAGSLHPFGFALLVIATTVYSAFAVALGLHYSSICRNTTRSLVATFATLIVLNGGYMMCCIPIFTNMGPGSELPTVVITSGMTFVVEGFAACSYPDVSNLFKLPDGGFGGWRRLPLIFGYLVSVGGYGLAAFLLFQYRIARFDEDVERPRRGYHPNRYPNSLQTSADASGIEFLEDGVEGSSVEPWHES
jgi:ABC-type transport system involved in multi-copper enzyme maturation permease subunit